MKRFGLIGYPVAHSLSPLLFRAGYGLDQIDPEEWKYSYDLIEGDDFELSYGKFLEKYEGINVTAPFKESAFKRADIADEVCRKTGASNLLVKSKDGIKAYNSDYYGIISSILETVCEDGWHKAVMQHGPRLTPGQIRSILGGKIRTALVAGCGGAGKAAAVAAGDMGLETVLVNRSVEKAEAIASSLPEYGFRVRPVEDFAECVIEADLIIYTLPSRIPAIGQITSDMLSGRKTVLEANYRDPSLQGEFIDTLKDGNACSSYIPGERWLLYQAYAGYDLFTGEIPDIRAMETAMKKIKSQNDR